MTNVAAYSQSNVPVSVYFGIFLFRSHRPDADGFGVIAE